MITRIFLSFCWMIPVLGASPPPLPEKGEVVIHNRIVTKVRNKTISILDVVKRMDLFLSKYYPAEMKSPVARFQFYNSQWKEILNQMIDDELMLADAESKEIAISDGEVREEILRRFGPNVVSTLSALHISYDEAKQIVQEDLTVQRMQWFRVTSKALQKVNSADVKGGYERYLQEHPPKEEWKYRTLSIRPSQEDLLNAMLPGIVSSLNNGASLESVVAEIDSSVDSPETAHTIKATLSSEITSNSSHLSEEMKGILRTVTPGTRSSPISQKSKDGSTVIRIFEVKDHQKIDPPKFEQIANSIKESLIQMAVQEEKALYTAKLRARFGNGSIELDLPSEFKPFELSLTP